MSLQACGRFLVGKDYIKIVLDADFCRYYYALLKRAHYNTIILQIPKHGAHIGVINSKIHKGIDCSKYRKLNGQKVRFTYDIEGNYGGFNTGRFMNYWLDVECKEAENILDELGIKKQSGFARLHITICNSKNL